jgi:hypothetical protein
MEALDLALDAAQDELTQAELSLCEAKARAESARDSAGKLEAAVAALKGEAPSALNTPQAITSEQTPQTQVDPGRASQADLSPEEFDKQRRQRQNAREREEQANNPLAHVKCSGCGTLGSMQEQMVQTPSGMPLRMLVCTKCNNQIMS